MVVGWGEALHVAHRFIELSRNLDLLENLLKRHIHVCISTYQFRSTAWQVLRFLRSSR